LRRRRVQAAPDRREGASRPPEGADGRGRRGSLSDPPINHAKNGDIPIEIVALLCIFNQPTKYSYDHFYG
jgi:hypothetical protein